jgi:acyl-CoA synthetase (AMP-forming)/AMP-acid ligase II
MTAWFTLLGRLIQLLRRSGLLTKPLAPVWLLWSYLRYGNSLTTLLEFACWRFPGQLCLHDEAGPLSYAALRRRSWALAAALSANSSQTIAILARNHSALVASLLACERLGSDILLLNTLLGARPIHDILSGVSVSLVICDREFDALLQVACSGLPSQPTLLYTDSLSNLPTRSPPPYRRGSRLLLLSSGTTGALKVLKRKVSARQGIQLAVGVLSALAPKVGEATLLAVPLLHGHGLATLALCLMFGAPLYLSRRPVSGELWRTLAEHDIRVLVLVPTILHRLLTTPHEGAPHLKRIVSGSAPLSAQLIQRTQARFGAILINVYGTSETGIIAVATADDLQAAPESVGRVLPGVQLTIRDAAGRPVSPGEPGELWIGHPPHQLATGDIGYLNRDGRLILLGRRDELINCGGEKLYPEALEAAITQALPYVLECAAIGIADEEYGQAVQLFAVLKNDHAQAELQTDLARLLPRSSRPKAIEVVAKLPRNALGKLERYKLTLGQHSGKETPED